MTPWFIHSLRLAIRLSRAITLCVRTTLGLPFTMRQLLITLCLFNAINALQAQEEISFPDTIFYGEVLDEVLLISLDKVGTIRQEVPELQATVIETEGPWYGSRYVLGVKKEHGYELLPIIGDDFVEEVDVIAMDVQANGHLQAVVLTMSYRGHTGWEHSIHERDWRVRVWDLHARRCVLDLATGYSREEWTNTFAPDSTDQLSYEERTMLSSEGDAVCVTYEPSFTPGILTLLRTDRCTMEEGGLDLPTKAGERVVYRLDRERWVKQ